MVMYICDRNKDKTRRVVGLMMRNHAGPKRLYSVSSSALMRLIFQTLFSGL